MQTRRQMRNALLGFCASLMPFSLALAQTASEAGAPSMSVPPGGSWQFDIAPQPLGAALRQFTEVTGIEVSLDAVSEATVPSKGAQGSLTGEEALRALLSGTGHAHRMTGASSAVVERASAEVRTETVTVSARRVETPISNIPGSVSVLESEQLEEELTISRDVRNALNRTIPGFHDFHNGAGPILRGRTALVLINGVPVNEFLRASGGFDVTAIEPEAIDRIEVSRGASAAYGYGAPGGIVSIETRRARSRELQLRTRVGASVNPHHIEDSQELTLYQSVEGGAGGPFDYFLGAFVADQGAAFAPNDDFVDFSEEARKFNLDGSFGFDLGDGRSLRFLGFYRRENIETNYFDTDFDGDIERNPDPNVDDSYRENYSFNLGYEQRDVLNSRLKVELLGYSLTSNHVGLIIPGTEDREENEYLGLRTNLTTPLPILAKGASVTYGFDFIRNRFFRPFTDPATPEEDAPFAPDITQDSYAGFAQLDVPLGRFLVSGGLRYEKFYPEVEDSAFIEGGDIPDYDATLVNVGVVYFLSNRVELFAGFSQGLEVTQLGRAGRDAISRAQDEGRRATPDEIKAEPAKSDNYEVGARGHWGPTQGTAAVFYSESDLASDLQLDPADPVNAPLIPLREPRKIWGVELTLEHRFNSKWSAGGLFSYQAGERQLPDGEWRDLSSATIQPAQVTAHLDYRPFHWWRNSLQATYTAKRDPFPDDSLEFDEGNVDSIFLADFFASFDVLGGELNLGIQNLFNKEYISIRNQASNIDAFSTPAEVLTVFPEEGRRVTLTYSRTW